MCYRGVMKQLPLVFLAFTLIGCGEKTTDASVAPVDSLTAVQMAGIEMLGVTQRLLVVEHEIGAMKEKLGHTNDAGKIEVMKYDIDAAIKRKESFEVDEIAISERWYELTLPHPFDEEKQPSEAAEKIHAAFTEWRRAAGLAKGDDFERLASMSFDEMVNEFSE